MSADICIVGAGAAGITMARALRDSGASVLVLEGGGEEPSSDQQDLYDGESSGDGRMNLTQCRKRALGGSTHCWAGWCRPIETNVFEGRDWVTGRGWPISRDELVPYYQRAADAVEIGAFEWDPATIFERRGGELPAFDPERVRSYLYQYSAPTRFGSAYRDDLEQADNVEVYLHANVTHVALGADGSSVDELQCQTLAGKSFTAEADEYVLAMGGIENPRMMLASDDVHPDGIGNMHGCLGRHFMEHPHYYGGALIATGSDPPLESFMGKKSAVTKDDRYPEGRQTRVRLALGVPASVQEDEQILTCGATLGEIDPDENNGRTGNLPIDRLTDALGVADANGHSVYGLTIRAEQAPTPESRIELGEQTDALGLPRVELDWQIPESTRESVKTTLQYIGAEFGRLGVGRLWMPLDDRDQYRADTPLGGCHHMGTTRMSERPEDGVVDENCKVHGVANLYVAGSSVFPASGFANPTLTICALAYRLADHLESTI